MAKTFMREFAMLASPYDAARSRVAGMYLSEKLDGQRALWLPATRGLGVGVIPFANRGRDKREHVATGLWTRYGKVIHCPESWLAGFPDYPLDGELYCGIGGFQKTMSVTRSMSGKDGEWTGVEYRVFDAPTYGAVFKDGRINNLQYKHTMCCSDNLTALRITDRLAAGVGTVGEFPNFDTRYKMLRGTLVETGVLKVHDQELTPFNTDAARTVIGSRLAAVDMAGGEGLILRYLNSAWEPKRSGMMYKLKTVLDAEGEVVGAKAGADGGKYVGMMGSLRVRATLDGRIVEFDLSGFTDEERLIKSIDVNKAIVGGDMIENYRGAFKIGETVTFKYRELTNDGMPKEARYWRKYEA